MWPHYFKIEIMKKTFTSHCRLAVLKSAILFSLFIGSIFSANKTQAQALITATGSYAQDFDALLNTGSGTWADNTTIANWYSQRTGTGVTITATTGSANAGGLYSFGAAAATDRSLGSVGSNNVVAGGFAHGVQFKNTSGATASDIKVSYTLEQWRNSGSVSVHQLYCYYKKSATIIDSLNAPDTFRIPLVDINAINGWTQIPALTLNSPITGGTAGALDGNLAANRVSATAISIPGLTLANNEFLMIKWDDSNHVTTDHGLGIDDVNISWTVSSTPVPSISASVLAPFASTCIGNTAGPNSFTLTGSNLTNANITVGPLSGYTFSSTNGGTYTTTLPIVQAGGTLASTTVYVKFSPTAAQSYDGNIPVAGAGASSINVAAVGTGSSSIVPTFAQIAPICTGGTFVLPTTSDNGINGSWLPAINNTATQLYTFTPAINQCAVSATMTVEVNQAVSSVATVAAASISSSGATLGGTITQGCAAITSYGVEYSTTNGFTPGSGTQSASTNLSGGSYTSTLSGLSASTTYYFITYAVTASGTVYGLQLTFTTSPASTTATGVLISQIYGAGGNSGSLFNADYVELHNNTTTSQTLTDYSIQYASATAAGSWSGKSKLPTTTIPAGGYVLVQMSSASTLNGAPLPTPDYISSPTISMSASNGRVALVSDTITLSACPSTANIADLVGYGTSICSETAPTPALDTLHAGFRNNNGCDDTNNNLADFHIDAPAPRNSASPVSICGVVPIIPSMSASIINSFGTICLATVAGPNSFDINGTNLTTANITVGPLAGYTFSSTSGGVYTASLTITQPGGTLTPTTVYVKFSPTMAQSYNGNIPVSGAGVANPINVAVTGSGSSTLTPTFDQIQPVCSGTVFTLPATSINGVTGNWTPPINNTNTQTYTFTPGNNQCAVPTTMIVEVITSITTMFDQVGPVCVGETFTLPDSSVNGVHGTWAPPINNTATTTYTFTPSAGQCATIAMMTVDVNPTTSTVETGDSTSIYANSAVLHGILGGGNCSPIVEYGIEYSGITGFINGSGTRVPANNLSNNAFYSQATGLVQNTVYYYKAYAKTSGTATYGEQKSFTTAAMPAGLTIYSTPIIRGTNVHYTLSGVKPGHYAARIFNSVGQLVYQRELILQVNFIDDNFILPAKLPIGLYTLQIFNPEFKIQKSMMVQ